MKLNIDILKALIPAVFCQNITELKNGENKLANFISLRIYKKTNYSNTNKEYYCQNISFNEILSENTELVTLAFDIEGKYYSITLSSFLDANIKGQNYKVIDYLNKNYTDNTVKLFFNNPLTLRIHSLISYEKDVIYSLSLEIIK